MLGVPASNLAGASAHVASLKETSLIMPPPKVEGTSFRSNSFFPYNTPIPVGPHILCPEKARKSQSNSCTLIGK